MKHLPYGVLLTLTLFTCDPLAFAVDRDGFGLTLTPEQREWVKNLRNQNQIPCCDDADGYEAEWDLKDNHYIVRDPTGNWIDVPPEAVITPNPLGASRAWFAQRHNQWYVRCFVAGDEN